MSDINSGNDQMLEMFLFEMSSLVEQLDNILLSSENNKTMTEDDINEIFRIMHTVKGSSAMMDFDVISSVTHKLEDTFFVIRENGIAQEHFTKLFDLMLDATDFLKSQLQAIQDGDELATGNEELTSRALAFLAVLKGETAADDAGEDSSGEDAEEDTDDYEDEEEADEVEEKAVPSPSGLGTTIYHIDVMFEEDCSMENLRAFMLVNTLKETCTVHSYEPSDIETNPECASDIMLNGFAITAETDLPQEELQAIVDQAMHVKSATLTVIGSGAAAPAGSDITGARYDVHIRFESGCGMENLRAFMLVNSLRDSCNVIAFKPEDIESNSQTAVYISEHGFDISLETPLNEKALQKLLDNAMHVHSAELTLVSAGPAPAPKAAQEAQKPAKKAKKDKKPAAEAAAKPAEKTDAAPAAAPTPVAAAKQAAPSKPIKQNLINVSLSKLDQLMDLMGELVITESMVIHSPDLKELTKLDNFNKSSRQLLKLTDELQDMVMSVRMIPVAGTFQKMQRIVRDMCRNLGKEATLLTMGEETDIDKTIIDGIADPIMHLVRNSMDHGIETPEERKAAGKNPKGTITLSAQNTGGEILITVSDDGKGLDAEALLNKAKNNGILTKPASEYTEKEAYMLLCAPGFSTKEQVTEYSGRGVGMDVVKKNIEKIGGTVVIESKKGYGMSVFLKIPLTLAIVDGMDISVGDGIYTLQITSINESFKATQDQLIVDTNGNEMIMIRGEVFPVIRLHDLYNIPDAITSLEDGIVIWVQAGDASACLFVDQLIGEQQIVVKPLPTYLKRYDIKSFGISGCTILGDGNISLILDVGSIIEKTLTR